jgi:hypothetical protein
MTTYLAQIVWMGMRGREEFEGEGGLKKWAGE